MAVGTTQPFEARFSVDCPVIPGALLNMPFHLCVVYDDIVEWWCELRNSDNIPSCTAAETVVYIQKVVPAGAADVIADFDRRTAIQAAEAHRDDDDRKRPTYHRAEDACRAPLL